MYTRASGVDISIFGDVVILFLNQSKNSDIVIFGDSGMKNKLQRRPGRPGLRKVNYDAALASRTRGK